MANRRRVYLARHGDVSYFGSDHGGVSGDPPLNARGIAQAEALGQALGDAPIDLAIATGLRRTVQTAEVALSARALDIEIVDALQEARTGTFEEVESEEEMRTLVTGAFNDAEKPDARFLTGESYAALWDRVRSAWRAILARDDWSCAFIACHGVVNRTLLAQAIGAGPQIYRRLEQDPGCLNVLDIDGAGDQARVAYVRLVNFTPYNPTKAGMHETSLESLWRQLAEA